MRRVAASRNREHPPLLFMLNSNSQSTLRPELGTMCSPLFRLKGVCVVWCVVYVGCMCGVGGVCGVLCMCGVWWVWVCVSPRWFHVCFYSSPRLEESTSCRDNRVDIKSCRRNTREASSPERRGPGKTSETSFDQRSEDAHAALLYSGIRCFLRGDQILRQPAWSFPHRRRTFSRIIYIHSVCSSSWTVPLI